jgi:hypothetical protein
MVIEINMYKIPRGSDFKEGDWHVGDLRYSRPRQTQDQTDINVPITTPGVSALENYCS